MRPKTSASWLSHVHAHRADYITPALAAVALMAVCGLGWVVVDQFMSGRPVTSAGAPAERSNGVTAQFTMCGRDRFNCVVDGDTVWWKGRNVRLQSFDTPEPFDDVCGGAAEVTLAKRASARLLDLLNSNPIEVQTFGVDGTGSRMLATIEVAGRDVGDILIEERLARRWPDGEEFWCRGNSHE